MPIYLGDKKITLMEYMRAYLGEKLVYDNAPYKQLVNYTMLYDYGDECTNITGGWEGTTYRTNAIVSKRINNIHIHSYRASAYTLGKINLTDYLKVFLRMYTLGRSTSNSQFIYLTDDIKIKNGMIDNETWTGFILSKNENPNVANYSNVKCNIPSKYRTTKHVAVMSDGGDKAEAFIDMYNFAIFKQDNWQDLCNKAGLTLSDYTDETALCADSTAISTILDSEEAVEYMIYQCTGSFMAEFIASSTALTALNNSQYKTIIMANEHWSKFLSMVA
jgi:hypothetical protein